MTTDKAKAKPAEVAAFTKQIYAYLELRLHHDLFSALEPMIADAQARDPRTTGGMIDVSFHHPFWHTLGVTITLADERYAIWQAVTFFLNNRMTAMLDDIRSEWGERFDLDDVETTDVLQLYEEFNLKPSEGLRAFKPLWRQLPEIEKRQKERMEAFKQQQYEAAQADIESDGDDDADTQED